MHCLSLPPTVSPPRSERSTQGASLRHIRCRSAPAASHCLSPVVRALHPGGEPPKQEVQVSSSAVRALHAGGEVSKLRAFGVRAESPLHFHSPAGAEAETGCGDDVVSVENCMSGQGLPGEPENDQLGLCEGWRDNVHLRRRTPEM